MKCAMLYGPGKLKIEEVEIPSIKKGEVLVEVRAALTCGTDIKTYIRGHPVLIRSYPSPFGHEFSGVISQVGTGVKRFTKGMKVVAANSAPCGQCYFCKKGYINLCEDLRLLNGAYAQYIVIPERIVNKNLLEISDYVSFEDAALSEPIACCLNAVCQSDISPGDTVAIIGLGPIGLILTHLYHLNGAKVIACGKGEKRLELSKILGASLTVDAEEIHDETEEIKAVKKLSNNGRGADIVVEAVGKPDTWEMTVKMVRRGGLVILFGGCPSGTSFTMDTSLIHYEQITIKGIFHHTPKLFKRALDLISSGKINTKAIISGRRPLEKLEEAFSLVKKKKGVKYFIDAFYK